MNRDIVAHTAEEMEEIGIDLADSCVDGMVISLLGPLGAGKTTLVKGLAKGLLIRDVVVSPSYLLAREYSGEIPLHHLDAYRISSIDELVEVGLDEFLPPQDGVSVIEWPDRVEGIIDISDVVIKIEPKDSGVRHVNITKP